MRRALMCAALLLCADPVLTDATCPTCSGGSTSYSQCGKWEAVPACSYVSGSLPSPQDEACSGGHWPAGLHAMHMVLLRTGKVLIWAHTDGATATVTHVAQYWDYRSGTGSQANRTLPAADHDQECAGMVVTSDGNVLTIGGAHPNGTHTDGHNAVYVFDPVRFEAHPESSWVAMPNMSYDRFYPTATLLPDGRILANAGEATGNPETYSRIPEVYSRSSNAWSTLSGAEAPTVMNFYPLVTVLPGPTTRVLHSGPYISYTTLTMQTLEGLDGSSPSWSSVSSHPATIPGSEAISIGGGKILKAGGADIATPADTIAAGYYYATRQSEIISTTTGGVSSVDAADLMNVVHDQQNMVALPNGKILAIGGQSRTAFGANRPYMEVFNSELFTPPTGSGQGEWCEAQPMTHRSTPIPRMYHSSALLLPDGRVLAAGGDVDGSSHCPQDPNANAPSDLLNCVSADFYKPPYLFKSNDQEISDSDRPTVESVPALIGTGESSVTLLPIYISSLGGDATAISSACLVRPSAVTHGIDMDGRYVPITISHNTGNWYGISAPTTLNDTPPGYYMLFVMNNADGVGHPSNAQFVRIWGIPEASVTMTPTQACNGNSATLTFTVSWKTTLATSGTNSDDLVLFPPGVACGASSGTVVAHATPNGTSHQVSTTVTCSAGDWKYVVESNASSGSFTMSTCRTITIGCIGCCSGCCHDCQMDE
jgi:galactose oxidase